MSKILLFAHSGFSDQNANGLTIKNLLSAWAPEEKAECYYDVQPPDFTAARQYFRVTDMDVLKAMAGKRTQHCFTAGPAPERTGGGGSQSRPLPVWLKKRNYHFGVKWLREVLRMVSPWGHRRLVEWIREVNPDVIVYMVGESLSLDRLVYRACQDTGKPLVLYNCEAFRVIDLRQRRGLDRAYYRKAEAWYEKLSRRASLVAYNCEMLKQSYEQRYPDSPRGVITYNSAQEGIAPYQAGPGPLTLTHFGNMGLNRVDSLLSLAKELGELDASLYLDVYGRTKTPEEEARLRACPQIRFHGYVSAQELRQVIEKSDILFQVESFDPVIQKLLHYAFSTKIAQCLCAGRCFVSYAPADLASTQYLIKTGGAVVVTDPAELRGQLAKLIADPQLRAECARRSLAVGQKNHRREQTAQWFREQVEAIRPERQR